MILALVAARTLCLWSTSDQLDSQWLIPRLEVTLLLSSCARNAARPYWECWCLRCRFLRSSSADSAWASLSTRSVRTSSSSSRTGREPSGWVGLEHCGHASRTWTLQSHQICQAYERKCRGCPSWDSFQLSSFDVSGSEVWLGQASGVESLPYGARSSSSRSGDSPLVRKSRSYFRCQEEPESFEAHGSRGQLSRALSYCPWVSVSPAWQAIAIPQSSTILGFIRKTACLDRTCAWPSDDLSSA